MVAIACKRFGVSEPDSGQIANDAVQRIVAEYGGTRPYIPMLEVAKRVRNEAIVANFASGRSLTWCSAKFRISKGRVRQILRSNAQRIGAELAPVAP